MSLATADQTLDTVIRIVAETTRFPRELLTPAADIEDELGIDSVKRAEIATRLATTFNLTRTDLAGVQKARTLAQLANGLAARVHTAPAETSAVANGKPTPAAAPASPRDKSLAGRVAFVSGSGRGLGRATALELARREAVVIVNSFHHREAGEQTVGAIRDAGGTAEHLWGSMARPDQIDRVFDQLRERFDRLDFFVHSASDGAFTRLADATEEQWLKSFRTNVIGLHRAAMRAAALMRPRGGRILTLSSVFTDAVVDYFGVQGTVKAAVESLTRFLAKELLPDGVAVNCVSFASLDGEVMQHYPEAERINGRVERASLNGRRSDDAEAARALAMLLGDDAAPITGAILRFDRGFCLGAVGGGQPTNTPPGRN